MKIAAVMGPDVPQAKIIQTFANAKSKHVFPEGAKRADLFELVPVDSAVFINDDIAKELQAHAEDSARRAVSIAKEREEAAKRAQEYAGACKTLTEIILKRSNLASKVFAAKQRRDFAKLQLDADKESKRLQALVEKDTKATADAEVELAAATDAVEKAKAAKAALEPKK